MIFKNNSVPDRQFNYLDICCASSTEKHESPRAFRRYIEDNLMMWKIEEQARGDATDMEEMTENVTVAEET